MKQKHRTFSRFQSMPKDALALIMGGDNNDEYITVIIDGVEYKIRINKNGDYISIPEKVI